MRARPIYERVNHPEPLDLIPRLAESIPEGTLDALDWENNHRSEPLIMPATVSIGLIAANAALLYTTHEPHIRAVCEAARAATTYLLGNSFNP